MTYNIHPIFVHFPIAFLLLYSVIRIFPLESWFPKISWKQIELLLLSTGLAGAFVALSSGEIAEKLVRTSSNHDIIEMHSLFATIATWTYMALLLGEVLSMFGEYIVSRVPQIAKVVTILKAILTNKYLVKVLVVVGLLSIGVTGILGGTIVYGLNADPFAEGVLNLLGVSY